MVLQVWQFILVAIAGLMNRQQQDAIAYLKVENRILREKLGHRRIILDASQKRRLARAAVKLGRDALRELGTIFSPDTLLRWHRWLIARKYDGSAGRNKPGPEPTKTKMVLDLVLRFAAENPDWGYGRITGELKKLGVRRVLADGAAHHERTRAAERSGRSAQDPVEGLPQVPLGLHQLPATSSPSSPGA